MLITQGKADSTSPRPGDDAAEGELDGAPGRMESQAPGEEPTLAEQLKALQFHKPSVNNAGNAKLLRRLMVGLAAACVVFVLYIQFGDAWFGGPPLLVKAIAIESDLSAAIVLDTSGFVLAETQVQIDAQTVGVLVELPIAEGDRVEPGDLLGYIDDAALRIDVVTAEAGVASAAARLAELEAGATQAEVEQAKAAIEQSEARVALTKAEFARAEQLKDTISAKEYESASTSHAEAKALLRQNEQRLAIVEQGAKPEVIQAAKAELKRAQALLRKAEHWVKQCRILSPLSGVVIELKPRVGETIRADTLATGFCKIADLSRLEIEVEVPERDLMRIEVGQPCRIEPEAFPSRFYPGHISRVLPVANRQRGVVLFRVRVDEPDGELLPNMNCRVVVLKNDSPVDPDNNLYVPAEAVRENELGSFLYVLDGRQARFRPVTLGEEVDRGVTVQEGLFPGETVLLPDSPLRDGQTVDTLQEGANAESAF